MVRIPGMPLSVIWTKYLIIAGMKFGPMTKALVVINHQIFFKGTPGNRGFFILH
jgi:hypothetical protein